MSGRERRRSDGPDDRRQLPERIEEWLSSSGYPFELRVADALRQAGFNVIQGELYRDPVTEKVREIDLRATVTCYSAGEDPTARPNDIAFPTWLRVRLEIECKSSPEKPWIVFTAPRSFGLDTPSFLVRGDFPRALLRKASADAAMSWLLPGRPRFGYGSTRAFSDNKAGDPSAPYAALQGAAQAALVAVAETDPRSLRGVKPLAPHCVFVLPMVVAQAPLFEYYWDGEHGAQLRSVEEILVLTPLHAQDGGAQLVRLCAPTDVVSFAKTLYTSAVSIARAMFPFVESERMRLFEDARRVLTPRASNAATVNAQRPRSEE